MNQAKTVDEYISIFPEETQKLLSQIRTLIKKEVPDAKETIVYGIPTFRLKGNLVHYGAYSTHIGFYPTPSAIEKFKKELDSYKTAKGSIQFPITEPLPLNLIKKIVKFRIQEQLKKK